MEGGGKIGIKGRTKEENEFALLLSLIKFALKSSVYISPSLGLTLQEFSDTSVIVIIRRYQVLTIYSS